MFPLPVLGILQPERQIGLKRIFIFLGIYLYLHTPRGAPDAEENARAPCRGVPKAKQCGSDNFSFVIHASQQKNQIPRHLQTANVGQLQRPVDKPCQNYQIFTTNMSKNVSDIKKSGQFSSFQTCLCGHEVF